MSVHLCRFGFLASFLRAISHFSLALCFCLNIYEGGGGGGTLQILQVLLLRALLLVFLPPFNV